MTRTTGMMASALLAFLLSGCTSEKLAGQHEQERQALIAKQHADRKVERSRDGLKVSMAATARAASHLGASQFKQKEAEDNLQELVCTRF